MNHSASMGRILRDFLDASDLTGKGPDFRITVTDTFGDVAEIRWNAKTERWEDDDGSSETTLDRLGAWRRGLEGR